jgi:hypothetical protein
MTKLLALAETYGVDVQQEPKIWGALLAYHLASEFVPGFQIRFRDESNGRTMGRPRRVNPEMLKSLALAFEWYRLEGTWESARQAAGWFAELEIRIEMESAGEALSDAVLVNRAKRRLKTWETLISLAKGSEEGSRAIEYARAVHEERSVVSESSHESSGGTR